MNVKLLRKIAAVIQERPEEFDMQAWHRYAAKSAQRLGEVPPKYRESCGTTHCIAGWAQVLSPERDCHAKTRIDAMRLLNLSQEASCRLFYPRCWPHGYGYQHATADQAAARIEHFIATEGME